VRQSPARRIATAGGALRVLRTTERYFLVGVFLSMVGLYTLGIVVRELGGGLASQFAWVDEMVRILNLFLVFGALGLALDRGRHVSITLLHEHLPDGLLRPLRRLIDLVGLLFSLYLMWLGWHMVDFVWGTGQRSPTLDISMAVVYVAPMLGFALLGLRYGLSLAGAIDRYHPTFDDGHP